MLNPILLDELRKRLEFLKSILDSDAFTVDNGSPEGRLRCCNGRWGMEYYHVTPDSGHLGKYIPKNNINLAASLAQKDYNRKIQHLAAAEYNSLHSYLRKYGEAGIETVYEKFNSARKELVTPVVPTDEQYLKKWMNVSYERKGFDEGFPEFYTSKGERVRSKSEASIADTLARMNIPYHCEYPFKTRRLGIIHPDFMVLNLRLRKTFFWEHCGKMDDPGYCRDWMIRQKAYSEEGVYPGERLIQTFEIQSIPLNVKTIEKTILHYLV